MVMVTKYSTHKSGWQVKVRFSITQHSRYEQLMRSLVYFLGCGYYYLSPNRDAGEYIVTSFSDITENIIPFFHKHTIKGVKVQDFVNFCKVVEIVRNKGHLTESGLEKILLIKAGVNRRSADSSD
jgi:hypothetical protein